MFWNKQNKLNKKLIAAAQEGNVRDITLLLDQGADIQARRGSWNCPVLSHAVLKQNLPAVKLLLDRGADIEATDSDGDTALGCAALRNNTPIIKELLSRGANRDHTNHKGLTAADQATKRATHVAFGTLVEPDAAGPPPAPVSEAAPPPAAPQNPDEVVLQRDFGGGRVLQEVFNFPALERISVIRHGAEGPVEAMTRESFSAIGDKAGLRRAFAEYAARGGSVSEAEVFPEALDKPKPARGL